MKTLLLLRHAKSDWQEPGLRDMDRPLNARGLRDAPMMARRFLARRQPLAAICHSPARRTTATANLFARELGLAPDRLAVCPSLYLAHMGSYLRVARDWPDTWETVMIVGHNPAITDFANKMAHCAIDNIPTCGLAELALPATDWSAIDYGQARLVSFDYPRKPPQPPAAPASDS